MCPLNHPSTKENEREARELAMCLAIPNHMMGEFYAHDEYLAFTLSEDFNVPLYIAKERIEYMNQRAIMYRD
jgi:Zn-dependent peptidase ImmA (M78 family)